uniref:SMC family ATPase n=1 Tax=Fervidicoccus fontis TaxID=683846 RepID=A0A7J3ZN28_9CREN
MSKILIDEVELEGFVSYKKKQHFKVPQSVTVLIGENGSGKTSLVEAIIFALTGKYPRGTLENTINSSSRAMSVKLKLKLSDGKSVEVYRERRRNGERNDYVKVDGKTVASGVNETTSYLAGLLLGRKGDDPGTLKNYERLVEMSIIRQGQIETLIELLDKLSTQEGKKSFDSLLGLDAYEKAYEKLRELKITVSVDQPLSRGLGYFKTSFTVTEESLSELVRELEKVEEHVKSVLKETEENMQHLREVESRIESEKREIAKLRDRCEKLKIEREQLLKKVEEYNLLRKLEEETLNKVEELNRQKADIERETAASTRTLRFKSSVGLELLERTLALLKKLYAVKKAHNMLEDISRILDSMYSKAKRFQEAGISLQDLLERLGEIKSYAEQHRLLTQKLADLEKQIEQERESLTLDIEKLARHAKELQLERALEGKSLAVEDLRGIEEALESKLQKCRSSEAMLEAKSQHLKEMLELLEKASKKCPLCGKPLNFEEREGIRLHVASELDRVLAEIRKVKTETQKLEELSGSIKELVRTCERRLAILNEVKRQLVEVESSIKSIERRVSKAVLENLDALDHETKNAFTRAGLNAKLLSEKYGIHLTTLLEAFENIKEFVSRLNDIREEVEQKLRVTRCEIESLSALVEKTLPPCLVFEEGIDVRKLTRLEDVERHLSRVQGIRRSIAALQEREHSIEVQIAELAQKLSLYRTRASELQEAIKNYKALDDEISNLETEISNRERTLERTIAQKENIGNKLEELRRQASFYDSVKHELERAKRRLEILLYVRRLFHRDQIPKLLRRYALKRLEGELNKLLRVFELSYTEASIDENLNIVLRGPYGHQSFHALSGGEKVAFAISFIVAFHKVAQEMRGITRPIGFMMLDEPTTYLDVDRKSKLIQILQYFKGGVVFPQLILVTHDDMLREASDNVFFIKKTAEGSIILQEEIPI